MTSHGNASVPSESSIDSLGGSYTDAHNYDIIKTGSEDSNDVMLKIRTSTMYPVTGNSSNNNTSGSQPGLDAFYFYKLDVNTEQEAQRRARYLDFQQMIKKGRSGSTDAVQQLQQRIDSLEDEVKLLKSKQKRMTIRDIIDDQEKTEQLIFLSLLFVFIVVGNCIVLLAVGLSRRRHSRMHFFILHLAIADLLVGLVTVFTDLVWKIYEKWYAGDAMCKMVKFAQTFVMFASTYMLVALSIDRYDAISRPLNFTSTWTRCKVLVGLAWCLSALFSSPMLFVSAVPEGSYECWITFPDSHHWIIYFACITASVLVLPALIITACYTLIIYIIWMNSHLLAPSQPAAEKKHLVTPDSMSNGYTSKSVGTTKGSPRPHRIRVGNIGRSSKGIIPQAKIRTVKMTFTIVLVFILCWSPYFVFNWLTLMQMVPRTQEMVAVSTFIQSLAPLNSAANPIIYGIFSTRICAYLRQLRFFRVISKLFCCADGARPSGVSEFSNVTDTEYTRRSPRFTERSDFTRRSPRLTETSDTSGRSGRPQTSISKNNMEMCHLILISVPRSQKFS